VVPTQLVGAVTGDRHDLVLGDLDDAHVSFPSWACQP
jgi:hypothetical protein